MVQVIGMLAGWSTDACSLFAERRGGVRRFVAVGVHISRTWIGESCAVGRCPSLASLSGALRLASVLHGFDSVGTSFDGQTADTLQFAVRSKHIVLVILTPFQLILYSRRR
jgi:hypothetical protein